MLTTKNRIFSSFAIALFSTSAFAGGFQMYSSTSPEALGLGGALSARNDLVSNAFFNPAALAFNERNGAVQVNMGAVKMHGERRVENDSRGTFSLETDEWEPIGSFFYHQKINEDLSFSFAITAPYGMETHWNESIFNIRKRGSIDQCLANIYWSPSLAYRITDNFSIALGLDLTTSSVTIRQGGNLGNGEGQDYFEADGYGWGYGWHAAAFWQINDFWSVGTKYQSSVLVDFTGDLKAKGVFTAYNNHHFQADLRLPQSISLGVANRYFTNWILSAEVVWTDWSSFQDLTMNVHGAPTTISEEKSWKPAASYRFGAEYALSENWKLRFGYCYDNNPIPTHTRENGLPGSNYHEFAIGVGYTQDNWSVDAGYGILVFQNSDSVENSQNVEYHRTYLHVMQAGFTYRF